MITLRTTEDLDPLLRDPTQTNPPAQLCYIFEPCGTPVSRGRCRISSPLTDKASIIVTDLDHPGRLVQRCLTGSVRRVWVHLNNGQLIPARVEDVAYDPKTGRRCVLHQIAPGHVPRIG